MKFVSAPSVEKTALVTKSGVQIFIGPATEMKKKDAVVRAILAQQKGKTRLHQRSHARPTHLARAREPVGEAHSPAQLTRWETAPAPPAQICEKVLATG